MIPEVQISHLSLLTTLKKGCPRWKEKVSATTFQDSQPVFPRTKPAYSGAALSR